MNDALNEYISNRFQKGNTNAFNELERSVGSFENIICAEIQVFQRYTEEGFKFEYEFYLKENYTQDDLNVFLNSLKEINYNSGYGGQNLFGTVWLTNNHWLERGEYDGSEWWEYRECPTIPENLK